MHRLVPIAILLALLAGSLSAQVTSPKKHFGFAIGDDYHLATYAQTEAYFKKVATESDRVRLIDIGRTEEGRTQWMVLITAPENMESLARFQEIARRLARAEALTDSQARALAAEGKAVVWIDGGLHASETVGTHQLIETVWQLASATDSEVQRLLKDVIVLCVHANPDGQELVSKWYMREPVPEKRVLTSTPRLYHKYIGHDNNRDFYMSAMKETANINRQLYLEWFPQIVYNHHQSGPLGTVMFTPPFRDPFNYVYDPLVVNSVQALGTAIQGRFLQEGKYGATSRSGANYSTWFNGSLRTATYFHNMIGLLTEVVGNPTPLQIPLVARRQLPSNDIPAPIAPQQWHFRQSIEYSLSSNRAVLDYASRNREVLLYNIYRMGRNSIERGSRDHWTTRPGRLDEIVKLAAAERRAETPDTARKASESSKTERLPLKYWDLLRKPEWRDPRGFIIPADQPDFPTAVKFINALVKNGIAIHRATDAFTVAGKHYPAGSFVVKTAQAFRPHVLDMFEPQDHPNDFRHEGGPPNRPYDVTGWTLAFQMGVRFDRVLEAFDGPFEQLPYGKLQSPPRGQIEDAGGIIAGFVISHRMNDTAVLTNRLLKDGREAYWLRSAPEDAPDIGSGALYIPDAGGVRAMIERSARQLGLNVRILAKRPAASDLIQLQPVRIALWDRFAGSMPSGWTRWLLEQFEFPFDVIFSPEIDAGKLREKYDAIIFVSGAIPAHGVRPPPINRPRNLPPEYESWIGQITPDKSIPALKDFLHAGGTAIAIGSATNLAYQLALPLQSALTERNADGKLQNLPNEKFYVPGSVLEAKIDTSHPLAWGMPERADFYFERSAAFTLAPKAAESGITPLVWFDSDQPLRSGWAWGQHYLKDSVTVATAPVGAGKLHLMGSEVAFRGQTHGTFKLLFNALYLATAKDENARRKETE